MSAGVYFLQAPPGLRADEPQRTPGSPAPVGRRFDYSQGVMRGSAQLSCAARPPVRGKVQTSTGQVLTNINGYIGDFDFMVYDFGATGYFDTIVFYDFASGISSSSSS